MGNKTFKDSILKQYEICVQSAEDTSKRRNTINNIFVVLNLGLLTAAITIWNIGSIFVFSLGMLSAIIWCLLIIYYRDINIEKYEIIKEIEKDLPKSPFKDEWNNYKKRHSFIEATKIESALPKIFIFVYVFAIIIMIHVLCGFIHI